MTIGWIWEWGLKYHPRSISVLRNQNIGNSLLCYMFSLELLLDRVSYPMRILAIPKTNIIWLTNFEYGFWLFSSTSKDTHNHGRCIPLSFVLDIFYTISLKVESLYACFMHICTFMCVFVFSNISLCLVLNDRFYFILCRYYFGF